MALSLKSPRRLPDGILDADSISLEAGETVDVPKSAKLIAAKRGRVLLVRRRRDGLWMFPGGRRRPREKEIECLRREIKEELPRLKLGRVRFRKEVKAKNKCSGQRMRCKETAPKSGAIRSNAATLTRCEQAKSLPKIHLQRGGRASVKQRN
jgi:hypothetical protein